MTIILNGNKVEVQTEQTLEALLLGVGITKEMKGIAIALNDEVVAKKMWSDVNVQPNDRIEIIRAVQGG